MHCATLLAQVERFVDGSMATHERADVAAHLARCLPCRELVDVLSADLDSMRTEASAGLTAAILERTSGRSCCQAHEQLAGLADGTLEGLDLELVQGHVGACPDCRALSKALVQLAADLPAFAHLQPVPGLVDDVLAATVAGPSSWRSWEPVWQGLAGRSRLAWEAGYVGAILLWLTCGTPWAPLRSAPAQALAVVQENHVGAAVGELKSRLTSNGASDLWGRLWTRVAGTVAPAGSTPTVDNGSASHEKARDRD